MDFEPKLRRQKRCLAGNDNSYCSLYCDDNFDGSYSITCKVFVSGNFNLSITLDELSIRDCPIKVSVAPGQVYPPNCFVWWGRYAKPTSLTITSLTGLSDTCGYGEEVQSEVGDALVFTVSCRDSFLNKVVDCSSDCMVQVTVRHGEERGRSIISTSTWSDSSSGVFPCALDSPSQKGVYFIDIEVLTSTPTSSSSSTVVQGSPFKFFVSDKVSMEETAVTQINDSSLQDDLEGKERKQGNMLEEVKGKEATRQRAEMALRKHREQLSLQKEEMRRKKAVRR